MEIKLVGRKEFRPLILTMTLFLLVVILFLVRSLFLNRSLWVPITLYFVIDVGFIVALVLGVRSRNRTVKIFSILSNAVFIFSLSVFIFLLLLAQGISEQ